MLQAVRRIVTQFKNMTNLQIFLIPKSSTSCQLCNCWYVVWLLHTPHVVHEPERHSSVANADPWWRLLKIDSRRNRTRLPAKAARLLNVRSTIKFSCARTSCMRLCCVSQNSMYASSRTTNTGSSRSASISDGWITEPSGLFGDVRNRIFGLYSCTAALMAGTSILKSGAAPRGTSMICPSRVDRVKNHS